MIIIPIGVDCGVSELLRKYNIRHLAYPFDWNVTYFGISKILENDFRDFVPNSGESHVLNHESNVWFIHDIFPRDKSKYLRRIKRLIDLLTSTTEEVVFIRKGHWLQHHAEHKGHFLHQHMDYMNDFDEIKESEQLDNILKIKYPNLKYKIKLVLLCGGCFNNNEKLQLTTSENIDIYIEPTFQCENEKFEKIFKQIVGL